ncbi:MAG TPA: hypothetical protein VN132_05180, partial [Bdellovibrio sp.]|nr:hypothetical protein [Bdellovibrio sp.]
MNKRNIRHSLIILVTTYITVAWPFSALSQAPVCDQIFLQNFSESQMESASHLETPKTASAPSYIHEFAAETLKSALLEGTKPYSLAYDVQKNSSSKWAFQRDIESLTFTFLQADSTTSRAEAFNKWVTSEEKALFLYDQLNKVGLSNFKEELDYLQQNNVYFIEGRKTGNGLLTYAFEKEGITTDITLFYRPPKIPEQTWLDMSEEDRFAILKKVPIQLKTFVGENVIAPTGLKPNFVGGYSQELSNSTLKGYGWEISHKKYEINRQRLMREIREIAGIFKSTHSFHVHIVFELPKKYERYKDFIYWYKQVNDYLYLKGLEEGLHGNYLTGVANIAADMSWGERIADWFRGFYSTH